MKDTRKDILFLCQFFYPEYVSSATLPFDIAKALSEAGFGVGAMCGYPGEFSDKKDIPLTEVKDNIFIKRLKYAYFGRKSFLGRLTSYFLFTFTALLHLYFCRNYKTVVVFSNPPVLIFAAYLAKMMFGCRLVFVVYDLYPEIAIKTGSISENGLISRVMKFINNRLYPNADRVVALSNEMKSFIVGNRKISPDKVCVIPNWYKDEGELEHTSAPDNVFYEKLKDKIVVSYLGNMGICQDIDTVLDAARKCGAEEKFHFLFAGHGCRTPALEKAIQSEKLTNVSYCGFLHGKDYLDALKISSYAVVSLVDGINGLCVPSKTYAYMMSNLPVIAILDENSDIASDITETNSGLVVKNNESDKILAYLREKHPAPSIRQRYLQKYESSVCLKSYVSFFKNFSSCSD